MKWPPLIVAAFITVSDTNLFAQGTDACSMATFISSPGTYPFNNAAATTDGGADCSGQPVHRDVWYCITPFQTGNYRIALCGGTTLETRLAVYNGNNCSFAPQIDCNEDACGEQSVVQFFGIAGSDYLIRIGSETAGAGGSGSFEITIGPGTSYCTDSVTPNSTGFPALITATGSTSVSANNIVLTSEPVPNQPGIFFYGPNQVAAPFGNGTLCIGGGALGIARLPVVNASGNVLTFMLDNTMAPTVPTQIDPGETWNFSTWFRDPMAGGAFFNLSDGLEITFTP